MSSQANPDYNPNIGLIELTDRFKPPKGYHVYHLCNGRLRRCMCFLCSGCRNSKAEFYLKDSDAKKYNNKKALKKFVDGLPNLRK